ncbi:MAG: molybdopterin-binding protein [Pseudomonadota bacterium]
MSGKLRNDCFALPPGVDWTPLDEALDRLLSRLSVVAEEEVIAVQSSFHRVLAKPVIAARSHPAHRNAAVDGYAIAFAAEDQTSFDLQPDMAAAGRPSERLLEPGQAVKILTGAKVPDGADAVVLQEESRVDGGQVHFEGMPKPGANIRDIGEDTEEGAVILKAGTKMDEGALAHAVSIGVAGVTCYLPLRVGVLSSGDEIVPPGETAADFQVFDANGAMLRGLLARWGYEVIDLGHVQDDEAAVKAAFEHGVSQCDAILTSGGASAGSEDYVSKVLGAYADRHTWRIAIKPGRPLVLAQWGDVPIFGLPGNPIAAFVCSLLFARPALQKLQGRKISAPVGYELPAGFAKEKKPGRSEYPRARITPQGTVELFASEGSGRVSGLSWADGLVALEHGGIEIKIGDPVRYIPFSSFD